MSVWGQVGPRAQLALVVPDTVRSGNDVATLWVGNLNIWCEVYGFSWAFRWPFVPLDRILLSLKKEYMFKRSLQSVTAVKCWYGTISFCAQGYRILNNNNNINYLYLTWFATLLFCTMFYVILLLFVFPIVGLINDYLILSYSIYGNKWGCNGVGGANVPRLTFQIKLYSL